jgi:uncharacterized protein YndB with AHSA1/START domain
MVDIKHQIAIAASPGKVYAAVATQAGLRGWWTADTTADERPGGKAVFGFSRHEAVYRMNIDRMVADKEVAWTCTGDNPDWIGTTLTWSVTPGDGATTLRFTHGGWRSDSDFYAMCNSTWGELMYRLKDYVEGRNPGPHWKE